MQRIQARHRNETKRKPRDGDGRFLTCCVRVCRRMAGKHPHHHHQKRRQHHHPHHFYNHRHLRGLRVYRLANCHHLRHFVHRRTNKQTLQQRLTIYPAPSNHLLEQHRVQKNAYRTKHHHRRHRHRDVFALGLNYRCSRQHRRRTTHRTARTNQSRFIGFHLEHARAHQQACEKHRQYHHHIGQHPRPAYAEHVLKRDVKTIQHNAQTQRVMFGKTYTRLQTLLPTGCHHIAEHHPHHDGQNQSTDAMALKPQQIACIQAGCGKQSHCRQAQTHFFIDVHFHNALLIRHHCKPISFTYKTNLYGYIYLKFR